MAKYLVIVESPTKVKTIKKFLGSNYEVAASGGHVRDLPKSSLGFDPSDDYEPHYITIRGKGDVLAALRKDAKKVDKIYLATDPDREGEAIAWHLAAALKLSEKDIHRIQFNEITKTAVKNALAHPSGIDMDKVNAQQTRRMLDRMVGYGISPLLWEKVKRGLSAGRVQSAVLRMICDRENEIAAFVPEEYWTVEAQLLCAGSTRPVAFAPSGRKNAFTPQEAEAIINAAGSGSFVVENIKNSFREMKAPAPFTTSTMQQVATQRLGFSTSKTMRIAQQLYEGIELGNRGATGMITYLRTDSTRIADEAAQAASDYIKTNYGENYLRTDVAGSEKKQAVQDAHEAIRPTDMTLEPVKVKEFMNRDQFRLYTLIWNRFLASRMAPVKYAQTRVTVKCGEESFEASTSEAVFDGYRSVYADDDEKEKKNSQLLKVKKGDELALSEIKKEQHFTQPAPHFNEASLVKAMEELGIGRPSTYAPTISTLLARRYVTKEQKNLYVTDLGEAVNSIMVHSFPSIVDVSFTANLETLLDAVGEGKMEWKDIIRNFYPDLEESIKTARENLQKITIGDEVTDTVCEKCGRNMVVKYGPHGKFLACPGFPECKNVQPYIEKTGVSCPKCGKDVVAKITKRGRKYYGCIDNPKCDFMSWQIPKAENETKTENS